MFAPGLGGDRSVSPRQLTSLPPDVTGSSSQGAGRIYGSDRKIASDRVSEAESEIMDVLVNWGGNSVLRSLLLSICIASSSPHFSERGPSGTAVAVDSRPSLTGASKGRDGQGEGRALNDQGKPEVIH